VYWFTRQRDAALFNSKEPEQLISKLVDVFFTKDIQQQSSARGSRKHDALCPTVLDACLSKSICFLQDKKVVKYQCSTMECKCWYIMQGK